MAKRLLFGCISLLALAAVANADTIHFGDFNPGYVEGDPLTWTQFSICPAVGQSIPIKVTGGEMITGAQLYLHIGDGDLVIEEPVFTAVSFAGGIFDDGRPVTEIGPGPQPGFEMFLDKGIAFNDLGDDVAADGLIGTVEIDASAFGPGDSFPIFLTWAETEVAGDPSSLAGALSTLQYGMLSVNAMPGDANCDGVVNDQDASILASHWQQSGMSWEDGDFSGDGIVNDQDASILAANWQQTWEGEGAATVPEPAAIVLCIPLCLAGLLLGRRKHRRQV